MRNFNKAIYEGTLVALCQILSRYNAFAQGTILKAVGEDLLLYPQNHGFEFRERGDMSDSPQLIDLFLKNGFAESLEVEPAGEGANCIWHDLYLFDAYLQFHELTDNPFLSCPLNLCMYYVADKHGKRMKLLERTFESDSRVTVSRWEVVDNQPEQLDGFDPLVIENARLLKLAEERASPLQ